MASRWPCSITNHRHAVQNFTSRQLIPRRTRPSPLAGCAARTPREHECIALTEQKDAQEGLGPLFAMPLGCATTPPVHSEPSTRRGPAQSGRHMAERRPAVWLGWSRLGHGGRYPGTLPGRSRTGPLAGPHLQLDPDPGQHCVPLRSDPCVPHDTLPSPALPRPGASTKERNSRWEDLRPTRGAASLPKPCPAPAPELPPAVPRLAAGDVNPPLCSVAHGMAAPMD